MKFHTIEKISFIGDRMILDVDSKRVTVDLRTTSPRLAAATEKQRLNFEISPSGYGIHWPELDEDLSVDALLGILHAPKTKLTESVAESSAMKLETEFLQILATQNGEGPVSLFLKNHPWVIAESFHKIAHANYVICEYPFGSDYRADFVVLGGYSGGWEIHFIELEPPDAPLFTRSGAMARRLNGAVHQVDCWRIFIDQNRQGVLRELSKFAMKRDLLRGPSAEEPTDSAGWRLDHPKSLLHFYYDIVIGRRADLDRDELVKKAAFGPNHRIEVMTYDRFIPAIRKIDQNLSIYGYE